jgi:hypothetical protein
MRGVGLTYAAACRIYTSYLFEHSIDYCLAIWKDICKILLSSLSTKCFARLMRYVAMALLTASRPTVVYSVTY